MKLSALLKPADSSKPKQQPPRVVEPEPKDQEPYELFSGNQKEDGFSDQDNKAVMEALTSLEGMIEEERRQKLQLEKKFDDLYFQAQFAPDRFLKPEKPSKLKNPLEHMAEEIIDLVQRRNELVQGESIFGSKFKQNQATTDLKNQLLNEMIGMVKRMDGTDGQGNPQQKVVEKKNVQRPNQLNPGS